MPGDSAKKSESVRTPQLDWQSELDATMEDIDSRLVHPRRRAADAGPQPTLPGLGEVKLTTELLDEIAWRVAEQMRRHARCFRRRPQRSSRRRRRSGTPACGPEKC